jgi:serine phosphatase RsbU (regulator of sigma subunit)
MGQLRGILRGVAYASDEPPSTTLSRFESTVAGLGLTALATTILARVARSHETWSFTWSSAGHLPPVVVAPGGVVTVLATEADLLLGLGGDRHDHEIALAPGSTVLLFTDGLVERREADIDEGLRTLARVLLDVADLPVDRLADEVLGRLVPEHPDDDVALLAVRLI